MNLLILLSLLLFACNPDDEPVIADAVLEGEWVLTNVSCFCGFEPETDFTLTRILFDTDNDKITVIQNGENTFFREAGEYFYGGQGDRIGFADDTVYRFEINGSLLTLTFQDSLQIADDEISYTFKR
jgi:hypothetical protein